MARSEASGEKLTHIAGSSTLAQHACCQHPLCSGSSHSRTYQSTRTTLLNEPMPSLMRTAYIDLVLQPIIQA